MKNKKLVILLIFILLFSNISFGNSTLSEDQLIVNKPYKIINISLTEEIDKNTVNKDSIVIPNLNYKIGFKNNYTISIIPIEKYKLNTTYTLTLTNNIQSMSGENLISFNQQFKFIEDDLSAKNTFRNVIVNSDENKNLGGYEDDTIDTPDLPGIPENENPDNTDNTDDSTEDPIDNENSDGTDTTDDSTEDPVDTENPDGTDTTDDSTENPVDTENPDGTDNTDDSTENPVDNENPDGTDTTDDSTENPVDNENPDGTDNTDDSTEDPVDNENPDDTTDEDVFEVRDTTLLSYSDLSRLEKVAHDILLGFTNLQSTIEWEEKLTSSEVDAVFDYIDNQKNHVPFTVLDDSNYIYELSSDKTEWLFTGIENIEYRVNNTEIEELDTKYMGIFNSLDLENKTNREISEIIALGLVKHFDYNNEEYSSLKERIYNQSYFSIMKDKTVCAGYTGAYSHLLNLAGIRNDYITVIYHSPGKSVPHIYNKVYLTDTEVVYTDVTHMDRSTEENPYNYREEYLHNSNKFFNEPEKREFKDEVKLLSTEITHLQ